MQSNFLDKMCWGNSVADYIWFVSLLLAALLLARPFTFQLTKVFSRVARRFSDGKYRKLFLSLVMRPLLRLIQTVLLYLAVNRLQKPFDMVVLHRNYKNEGARIQLIDIIDHLFIFFTIYYTTVTIARFIDFVYRTQLEKARRDQHNDRVQILPLLKEVIKLLLWTMAFFTILGMVFHVNIPALITGLGIGGVAIALAAKESVENLFASFTIMLDKPFRTYDTVRLGTLEGTVEKIGFRSTRLRNANGSVFIIPNKKLIDESLENLTVRELRRVQLKIALKYGIKYEALQKMLEELKKAVHGTTYIIEPVEVTMEAFGENAFQLLITYHLPFPLAAGTKLEHIKHEVNLRVYEITARYAHVSPGAVEQSTTESEFTEEEGV